MPVTEKVRGPGRPSLSTAERDKAALERLFHTMYEFEDREQPLNQELEHWMVRENKTYPAPGEPERRNVKTKVFVWMLENERAVKPGYRLDRACAEPGCVRPTHQVLVYDGKSNVIDQAAVQASATKRRRNEANRSAMERWAAHLERITE